MHELPAPDMYVLDALVNDIEGIENILVLLNNDSDFGWRSEWGRPFARADVVESLRRLRGEACVQVYVVSADLALASLAVGELPIASWDDAWFGITDAGRARHQEWGNNAPFDGRVFREGDEPLFAGLMKGFLGARCVRAEETYADGIVLEFGRFIPKKRPLGNSPRDRGEWAVSSWGCDLIMTTPDGSSYDSRSGGFDDIRKRLAGLTGAIATQCAIDADDLSLQIQLSTGIGVRFAVDNTEPDLDQWFILFPDGRSVGVKSSTEWFLHDE
jgi:hypothetical protein